MCTFFSRLFLIFLIEIHFYNEAKHLDVILNFNETQQPISACNLVSLTINNGTEKIVDMMKINQPYFIKENSIPQKDCFYQQFNNDLQANVKINVSHNKISGFVKIDKISFYVKNINFHGKTQQTIRMFSKHQRETKSFNQRKLLQIQGTNQNIETSHVARGAVYGDTKYFVELYVICDSECYKKHGSQKQNVKEHIFRVINNVNGLFRKLKLHLEIVGLDIWESHLGHPMLNDPVLEYKRFQLFRNKMTIHHDYLLVFNGFTYKNGLKQFTKKNGMCLKRYSIGFVSDEGNNDILKTARLTAMTIAQSLGVDNDDNPSCSCPPHDKCIMSPDLTGDVPREWSICSNEKLNENLNNKFCGFCLRNVPKSHYPHTSCGNGKVDHGEDCDPGMYGEKSECCNTKTCKFHPHAKCAFGPCCNKLTCQFHRKNVLCRHAKDECDKEEHCDGKSDSCPENRFVENGEYCDNCHGTCYNGRCGSHRRQCKKLFGQSSVKGHDACFEKNVNSHDVNQGYCHYSLKDILPKGGATYSLTSCLPSNRHCGTLHCEGSIALGWSNTMNLATMYSKTTSTGNTCSHFLLDTSMSGERDPGMVPNGALCDKDKVCINSECIHMNKYGRMPKCEKRRTTHHFKTTKHKRTTHHVKTTKHKRTTHHVKTTKHKRTTHHFKTTKHKRTTPQKEKTEAPVGHGCQPEKLPSFVFLFCLLFCFLVVFLLFLVVFCVIFEMKIQTLRGFV